MSFAYSQSRALTTVARGDHVEVTDHSCPGGPRGGIMLVFCVRRYTSK